MTDLFAPARWLDSLPPTYTEPWLLESIWTRNGFNVLVGAPKARKSTLRRYLTACALAGASAFGRFPCRNRVTRVLICFGEGAIEAEGALMHRACALAGLTDAGRRVRLIKPFGFHLDQRLSLEALKDYVADEGFDLVIIDPLLYFHGREENDALGMGKVCTALIELATTTAVVVIHHTAKAQANTPERPVTHRGRGSSTLGGAADTYLELTRTGPTTHCLEFATRSAEEPEKLFLNYDPIAHLWTTEDDPLDALILAQLRANPGLTGAELVRDLLKRKSLVMERLKVLVGTGVLRVQALESRHGNRYFVNGGNGSQPRNHWEPLGVTP